MKFLKIRKNILLLFVICITLMLSGCENSMEIPSDAATYPQAKQTNITQSSSTTTKSNKDKDKKEETTEIKTIEPSEDVFKDFFNDVEINGIKLSLPCSYEELSKNFDLQKDRYLPYYYDEEMEKYRYSYEVRYEDNLVIYAEYCSKINEENFNAEDMLSFFVSSEPTGNNACLFRFGKINNYSNMTQNDVEKILGKPDDNISVVSWYQLDDSQTVIIDYAGKNSVYYINCFWKEKENNNE